MKTYMPLDGFRWSCDSDSALCDMRQTNVLGRAGGEAGLYYYFCYIKLRIVATHKIRRHSVSNPWRPCVDIKNIKRNLHALPSALQALALHAQCYIEREEWKMERNVSE